jgi:DNA-binding transcriptional LysR family regulator
VPSVITYTMKKLEQDLEIALFDRSGHKAKLTDAGKMLLKEGQYLLDSAGNLQKQLKKSQMAGKLS